MMQLFFSTSKNIDALDLEARSWVGTPFVPHAMIKGAGADCVHLVAGIYRACGALARLDFPDYALDEGQHLGGSKILAWFEGRPDFAAVATTDRQPGDTLAFRLAGVEHHVGLMLKNDDFIHALPGRKAIISNLRESFYRRRITACFRPTVNHLPESALYAESEPINSGQGGAQ